MSTSFTNYLLVAVSTVTIHPIHCTKDEMDILMKKMAALQYWSSEFATNPMPDTTNLWKPDLVLLDYRLRKFSLLEKSWKTSSQELRSPNLTSLLIANTFVLGGCYQGLSDDAGATVVLFYPTFGISKFKLCAHYMDCSGMVISKPLPIVTSPIFYGKAVDFSSGEPSAIMFKTSFNQEYALKDCWVDEDVKDIEIRLLKAVKLHPKCGSTWEILGCAV
ncbi:uncharacterized protein EDB91DRAFT_1086568 [Suillus paluster]|uniref:uncharacterized protein n=1 Tax=Suillus paluster TaxID=48578 RepID=UPI001B876FFC|nr:uncharacterized protein EDB91DRAFT_1086568 [Suillus paluster]KAG1727097.1 hypothetical protein EDB91DRAFT_1086568 [Suillus paluster]